MIVASIPEFECELYILQCPTGEATDLWLLVTDSDFESGFPGLLQEIRSFRSRLRSRPSDVGFVMSDDPGFWSVFEIHPMDYGSGVPHGVVVKAQDV